MRPWAISAVCAAALIGVPPAEMSGGRSVPRPSIDGTKPAASDWEHRYRVDGKIWLVMWMGRSDIGAARLSRQQDGTTAAITFLGGSNPDRLPGNVNQWGYSREQIDSGRGRAFIMRTLDPRDPAEPEA